MNLLYKKVNRKAVRAKKHYRIRRKISGTAECTRLCVYLSLIHIFRKLLDYAETGDNIGCLLRGIDRKEVERGQVLAKPGSIHPHTKFEGEVYVLTKEEGGRHTPFFNGYRPQFYFRTTDVTGVANLPEGVETVSYTHLLLQLSRITST